MRRYSAPTYPGRLILTKADQFLGQEPPPPDLGWGAFAKGGVEIHRIPGNHYSILREPNVRALADRFREILDGA